MSGSRLDRWARRAARAWLRALAPLVPESRRSDWLEEWAAELDAPARDGAGSRPADQLLAHAGGALPDALHLRVRAVGTSGWGREIAWVFRGLVRRPGFTVVALLTLALGIGANAALFTVVRAVLLEPLPFHEPERLVRLWGTQQGERQLGGTVSYPDVHDIGARTGAIEAVAAFDEWRPALGGGDGPLEVVYGGTVNTNFFDVLGVQPIIGRGFLPGEEGEGREPAVLLGHGLWRRRFGGDPAVVGRTIDANGTQYRVLGVLPPAFETPGLEAGSFGDSEIWRTPGFALEELPRSGRSWAGVARLRDDVSLASAQAEADAVTRALAAEFPFDNESHGVALIPLREQLVGEVDRALWLLFGSSGLVLLIACANVASLLLVRSVERRRELAVRVALGASRARLAISAAAESVVLALFGGALGIGLAYGSIAVLGDWAAGFLPRAQGLRVSPDVLAFAAVTAIGTGILFGVGPAIWAARARGSAIGGAARGATGTRETVRFRRALVRAEVALSVLLLVGAGLCVRTLDALYDVELGVAREGVATLQLHLSGWTALELPEAEARYARILDALRAVPGVAAVGAINILPLGGGSSCDGTTRDDRPPPAPGEEACVEIRTVLPGVFDALGLKLVSGRLLDGRDRPEGPYATVVSSEMAEAFFPGEDPLGKRITMHGRSYEVVGIVSDLRHFGPSGVTRPMAYMPAVQDEWGGVSYGLALVVRGRGDAADVLAAARAALASADPAAALQATDTMDELIDQRVAQPRFRAALLGAFAALAAMLAVVGLGGVMAYSVRQRTREIGLRVALGAAPGRVTAMVLREGVVLTGGGLIVGTVAAVIAADLLRSMVFGIDVRDPLVILGAPLLLGLITTAAVWLPARRAARVDPMRALTTE
jgi:putative ABC transport system permease protein